MRSCTKKLMRGFRKSLKQGYADKQANVRQKLAQEHLYLRKHLGSKLTNKSYKK